MSHIALIASLIALLSLNGSVALASQPACSSGVCVMPLAMMVAPPARPAGLAQRHPALLVMVAGYR